MRLVLLRREAPHMPYHAGIRQPMALPRPLAPLFRERHRRGVHRVRDHLEGRVAVEEAPCRLGAGPALGHQALEPSPVQAREHLGHRHGRHGGAVHVGDAAGDAAALGPDEGVYVRHVPGVEPQGVVAAPMLGHEAPQGPSVGDGLAYLHRYGEGAIARALGEEVGEARRLLVAQEVEGHPLGGPRIVADDHLGAGPAARQAPYQHALRRHCQLLPTRLLNGPGVLGRAARPGTARR